MTAHACHNKPRHDAKAGYITQSGWSQTFYDRGVPVRTPIYVEIVTDFKPGCKYDKAATDARCDGCGNKGIA